MNKIKLIKHNKKLGHYIFKKELNHFTEFILLNGIKGVYTDKNFYLDTESLKIRYSTMTGGNVSYNILRDYYLEITDGVYLFQLIGSDNLHDSTIARLNVHSSAWKDLDQQVKDVIAAAKEI